MELDLWTQSLVTAMTALWTKVANFIPNLFGALVLVLLGFVVAKLLDTCCPNCWPNWASIA
jgi:hypothetical protein